MSYFKLDTQIIRSSLWRESDAVAKVFITAMLEAKPVEFEDDVEVYDLDGNLTDLTLPPGWYGFVEGSWACLIDDARTNSFDDGKAALLTLGAPDPRSSSPAFGGREILCVSGGLVVVNFLRYRPAVVTNAKKCRDYRTRRNGSMPARLRFEVLKRDGFRCQYCGAKPAATELHVDHVIPVSRGGSNCTENLTTACDKCNLGKSNIGLDDSVLVQGRSA